MSLLQIISLPIMPAGAFRTVNSHDLRLPAAVGISVALALSLPDGEWKPLILGATYMIVVFSIIVQGLTVTRLACRIGREPELEQTS